MYFVLMPDGLSSRHCRQFLADTGVINVTVGSYLSLFEQIAEQWLLNFNSMENSEFESAIRLAAYKIDTAFWSKSLSVDEVTTLGDLSDSLKHVYSQLPLSSSFQNIAIHHEQSTGVSDRTMKYWNDLGVLCDEMNHLRPHEQQFVKQWMNECDTYEPLSPFIIIVPQGMFVSLWLEQAINHWNVKSRQLYFKKQLEHQQLSHLQQTIDDFYSQSTGNQALTKLSEGLYNSEVAKVSSLPTEAFSIIAARDELEECQTLISRLGKLLGESQSAEVAVVVPKHSHHKQLLQAMLLESGINFSSLNIASREYQWDVQLLKELIELFVTKKKSEGDVASVQYGSVLVNPLMPWSLSFGQREYRSFLVNEDYVKNLEDRPNGGDNHLTLLKLLFSPIADSVNAIKWLECIAALLRMKGRYNQSGFIKQLERIKGSTAVESTDEHYADIARQLDPQVVETELEQRWLLNSVQLLSENDMLLKPVDHLFIVGFNKGAYEVQAKIPGVFQLDQWRAITQEIEHTDYKLDLFTSLMRDEDAIARFRQLLCNVRCGVYISLSEQSLIGEPLQPSSTLFELALLIQDRKSIEPELLIQAIKEHPENVPYLHYEEISQITEESDNNSLPSMLEFKKDLLALNADKQGEQRPESPTSLIRMMISPLAWLLDKQNIRSLSWEAEQCSPRIKGIIVHCVFEYHFGPNENLNLDSFEDLFDFAIKKEAPFLNRPRWRLEKASLKADTKLALEALVGWCDVDGWQNIAQEQELTGTCFGLPIRGTVDALFSKDDTTLILDYKTSGTRGISLRFNTGYDIQTELYTEMVKQSSSRVGDKYVSGYYSSKEQKIVSNYPIHTKSALLSNIEPAYKEGISSSTESAKEAITNRIGELREGKVELNQQGDIEVWSKYGHKDLTYWLEEKPLLKAHTLKNKASGE